MHNIIFLIDKFFSSPLLPTAMQGVGMALLTILIPVVIFIFSSEKETLFEWEKNIILDKVIRAKKLIISIALIFFPLFFWNYDLFLFRFFLFPFFIYGVINLVKILYDSYHWIKATEIKGVEDSINFRESLRNEYFQGIRNVSEKENIWGLAWQRDISNIIYERSLIKNFIMHIDALIKEKNYNLVQEYLQNFFEFTDKRALYDRNIFESFFSKLLEWYFLFCVDEKKQKESNDITRFLIEETLLELIEKYVLSALQKRASHFLFEILKKEIKNKDKECTEKLFTHSICIILFNNVTSPRKRHHFWENHFPEEWKITKETFKDETNFISKIWLNEFLEWAKERIQRPKNEFDENLDGVSFELFPSVDPILWAQILTLLMRPWSGNNQMKSLIEQGSNFGHIRRDDEIESQKDSTLKLALLLFENEFTKERLEEYLNDLKNLKYDKKTREENSRNDFIKIFNEMTPPVKPKNKKSLK